MKKSSPADERTKSIQWKTVSNPLKSFSTVVFKQTVQSDTNENNHQLMYRLKELVPLVQRDFFIVKSEKWKVKEGWNVRREMWNVRRETWEEAPPSSILLPFLTYQPFQLNC